jgi:UDP-sugar transporter A1/2/3
VTTGVLLWAVMGRRLTLLQWVALVLLTMGAATSQLQPGCAAVAAEGSAYAFQAPPRAYFMAILGAVLSAVASVYNEWLLKGSHDSLHWLNAQLYFFGVLFTGGALAAGAPEGARALLDPSVLLRGAAAWRGWTRSVQHTWRCVCMLCI